LNNFSTLAELIKGEIRCGAPMSEYTSYRVGGPADCLVFPADADDLKKILGWCRLENRPYFLLGNGTNLLVRDGGIRGCVVSLSRLTGIEEDGDCIVRAGAGEPLGRLVEFACRRNLAGLEFAAGIPGSVGGALVMNAGAFQGEMKGVVECVRFMDAAERVFTRTNEGCRFAYRYMYMQNGEVILEGRFRLKRDGEEEIRTRIDEIIKKRMARHPYDLPSAGSVFKNPSAEPAARLIEGAGLKGTTIGGAQVSEKHANFIVNCGRARAQDVLALIRLVQDRVFQEKGIRLEPEIRIVGEES
jgi:UDP-N-acetylmuramate dehydrogenase